MSEQNQPSSLLEKIVAYTELLVKDPRSTIFVSLAETYRKLGHLDDAGQIIDQGLELHPSFGPAHIVLARIKCQLGDYAQSCEHFERALELDPNSLAALVGYARVKLILEQEDEARNLLLHARTLSPADPVINKLLLGLTPAPVSVPTVEEEQQPEPVEFSSGLSSLASTTLADLYLKQGITGKALSLYRRLLLQDPDNLDLRRKIRSIEEGGMVEPSTTDSDESVAVVEEPCPTVEEDADAEEFDSAEEFVAAETPDQMISVVQPEPYVESDGNDDGTSAVVQVQTVIEQDTEDPQDNVVEELNRWLDNIRTRREQHVH